MRHTPIVELDHLSLPVRGYKRARRFYGAALGALGMRPNFEDAESCGFGSKKQKIFWVVRNSRAKGGGHYAFRVTRPDEVDAFFHAATAAGGTDHGAPGPRPEYGRNYYAAFVLDPEGNNIEVVCYERRARPARSG